MRKFFILKFVLLIVSVTVFSTSSNVEAQFYTLGPGDGLVDAVSDNGIAVGSFLNSDNEYFSWEIGVGGKVNIGGAVAGNGVGGQPSISNDGMRIGGTEFNSASGFNEMSYYDTASGTWTSVGGIGSSSGTSISSGWGISGDGQTLVGLGWVNAGEAHGISWNGGAAVDLGTTVTNRSTRANAANFDGTVIGGWQDDTTGFRQGAVWVNGDQELIFNLAGQQVDEVSAISEDGQYASGLFIAGFGQTADTYRYDINSGTVIDIENTLGTSRMAGAAINADGSLIGGGMWNVGPATLGDAFLWEEGVGTMSVEDYLTANGVGGWDSNFEFSFVTGISSDGQWIVGWGRDGTNSVSWAARINSVPEPAGAGLLVAIAATGLCRRRKRSR